jgi:hypothetical protein
MLDIGKPDAVALALLGVVVTTGVPVPSSAIPLK